MALPHLQGLSAAELLKDSVIKGQPPNELLLQLKQGPAKHVKNHAYACASQDACTRPAGPSWGWLCRIRLETVLRPECMRAPPACPVVA